MTVEVARKLQYADRFSIQQADQAIKRDVVRALIELVTNSDDSYRRLEQQGKSVCGEIRILVRRKWKESQVGVADCAEGMTGEVLDQRVGVYAEDTSGFSAGADVRGFFGRGLKDSIIGLGNGSVYSISDGSLHKCSLFTRAGTPFYQREKSVRVTRGIRRQYWIEHGNGTYVEVVLTREGVRIPLIENLRRQLEFHYSLREILSNAHRQVTLMELGPRGEVKREMKLQYKYPIGEQVLDKACEVPGFNKSFTLNVVRSAEPLAGPSEEGDYAPGGLVVKSQRAVLDLSLFRFAHDPAAERLYGTVTCKYLDELLLRGEPIVKADRTGIDWSHGFAKALQRAVETEIGPLVEEERERLRGLEKEAHDQALRKRISGAMSLLNKIAQMELGKTPVEVEKTPYLPEDGFGFVPQYYQVVVAKPAMLLLRADAERAQARTLISIESESETVYVHTPQVVLEKDPEHEWLLSAKVIVEGKQVGAESIIIATTDALRAEALTKVVSKRVPPEETKEKKRAGLFKDVRFDPHADPRHRVRYDDGYIVIAVNALSVAPYLREGGKGSQTPQGQVMLAELVAEAVCKEIARSGVSKGRFLAPPGGETAAIQREFLRIQNEYAHRIHELFVDQRYRAGVQAKKGRPSKEEMLERATVRIN
ncbi:MAG TPA: hypothetical protein VNN18_03755 [Candidatus Xenobia bacterium]|nr:hypothetical protein [Candidatus Xenobia bacterium]